MRGKRWLGVLALLFLLAAHLHPVCRITVAGEELEGRFSPAQVRLAQQAAQAAAGEILDAPTALIRPRCFYRLSLRPANGRTAVLSDAILRRANGLVLADGISVNGGPLGTVSDGTLGGNLQIQPVYSRAGHETPVWDMVLRITGAAPVFYLDADGKVV